MTFTATCWTYPFLPWNYLPLAICDENPAGDGEGKHGRMVSALFDFSDATVQEQNLQDGYPFINLASATLSDPEATNEACKEFIHEKDEPLFIGQRIVSPERSGVLVRATPPVGLRPSGLVVIDCGIAHWNDEFWPNGNCRFKAVHQIRTMLLGLPGPTTQNQADLKLYRDLAVKDGPMAPVPNLAKAFPDSFWGLPPDPDEFWHGTATAALAAKAQNTDLIGIELPKALLLDWGGDKMTLSLWQTLFQAVALLSPASLNLPKGKILLPFGFTGGPHDGHHPAAKKISSMLAAFRDVELILPAGNHRQDRLHARLTDKKPKVVWGISPDDASANVLDLHVKEPKATFILRAGSTGAHLSLNLTPGSFCKLVLDRVTVGHVHARRLSSNELMVRVALAPRAAAGAWEIEMEKGQNADLWILRDDPELALNRKGAEQSRFFDDEYIETDAYGYPEMSDGNSVINRAGMASVLTTGQRATVVAAKVMRHGTEVVADYSGLPFNRTEIGDSQLLGDETDPGPLVIGNGSPRLFRAEGTSIAAADFAAKLTRARIP